MRSGTLRHQVQVWKNAETQDAEGPTTYTPALDGTRWAQVEPLTGREFFAAGQMEARHTHRVRMRYYDSSLNSVDYYLVLIEGTRTLQINSVSDIMENNREIELMCTEVKGA